MTNTTDSILIVRAPEARNVADLLDVLSEILDNLYLEGEIEITEVNFTGYGDHLVECLEWNREKILSQDLHKITIRFPIRGEHLQFDKLYSELKANTYDLGAEEPYRYSVTYAWTETGMDGYGKCRITDDSSSMFHRESPEYESESDSQGPPVPKGKYAKFLTKYFPGHLKV